jgi:hypothetical protein
MEPVKRASVLSRAIRASDVTVVPKLLISGEHGAGKTHLMATAENLFVVAFEGNQSKSTIQHVNPGATIYEVSSIEDWRDVYNAMMSGELSKFSMLGIDSLTEMQAYYDRDFDAMKKKADAAGGKAKDDKWGKFRSLKTSMGNVFVFLRDIPMAVAATIRTKPENDVDTGTTRYRFNLDGDARNNVGAYFTATCFVYKMDTGVAGQTRRAAMFSGSDNYPSREMLPHLKGICEPSIPMWLAAIAGNPPDGLYIPDARLPGEKYVKRPGVDINSF